MTKDARGFVDGVLRYLKQEGKAVSTVPKVQSLLHKVSAQARKEKEAYVTSAVALSNTEKQDLAEILANLIGHAVHLETRVDSSLVGGLKIQVGDWIVDTSLRGQLESMGHLLV